MSKNKNKMANALKAQNALEHALRLTDYDYFSQASLSSLNAYKNVKIDLLSLQQILLTNLYKTYGILAKVVDVPVDDAYRNNGFEIHAETIDDKEIKKLENELRKNRDIEQLKQARKWARLFGGSALIVLDGKKLSQPVTVNSIKNNENVEFMAVDRWQLTYSLPNVDMPDGKWNLVNYGKLDSSMAFDIHPSRVHILHGKRAPYIVQQQVQGWGISVYEQIFQDMSQFFKGRNVMFELMDDAKTDIIKLSALQTAISSGTGERAVQRMVDLIARNKNYKSQITLSTDDDYEQKQISFSGFEGVLKEIRVMMAGSANMPVSKLWGEGVTGFGSGEDSLENYNAQIEADVRSLDESTIYWILKIRCWQLFGRDLEDLEIEWKSLRVLGSTEQQQLETSKMDNILKLFDRQIITPQEVMEMLKNEGVIIHDTKAIRGELEDMDFEQDNNDNSN